MKEPGDDFSRGIELLRYLLVGHLQCVLSGGLGALHQVCLLYTSDAADERSSVVLVGRRIIKNTKKR